MITTTRAVVVEGRYDKIKLDSIVDALIVTTDGFNIFKDKEKQALLRRLGRETGLVLLTDSDDAGFKIRKYVEDIAGRDNVLHAYIPERQGKERRKAQAGAVGLLGVEGVDAATVERALQDALAADGGGWCETAGGRRPVTVADLCEDRLNGCAGAQVRRAAFLRAAELPTRLSTNAFLALINRLLGYERYKALAQQVRDEAEVPSGAETDG